MRCLHRSWLVRAALLLLGVAMPAHHALAGETIACCAADGTCATNIFGVCPPGTFERGFTCTPNPCAPVPPSNLPACTLVTNGGFETGDFSGWTQFGDPSFTAVGTGFAHTGLHSAFFGPLSTGGIRQTIALPAGSTVTIMFSFRPETSNTPNFFSADFGGQNLITINDATNTNYTEYSFTVTTAVANPELSFSFTNPPSFSDIDDISVCLTDPCDGCWNNGAFDGPRGDGQISHLGGASPLGAKAADDFTLMDNFVHDVRTFKATLLTTTTVGLVKPRAEIWSDCNGCPSELLYTFTNPLVVETGLTQGFAFDGRPLRIVNVTFDVTQETTIANRNVVLHGGNYWLSVYGVSDGLGPTMQMYDVTYWGTTRGFGGGVQGKPAHKIDGLPSPNYNVFTFPAGCGPTAWHSVVDDCCIGCTDLNFSFCATPCKILVDNGGGRRQLAGEPVGSTSKFAAGTFSAVETRSADDFVIPGCGDHHICYVEACILTNCVTFDGVFELYANDCNKPSYALHGTPLLAQQFIATKIIPLNYTAFMEGKTVTAYKLEFHDLNIVLPGGRQYWISAGVKYTFSINERAFFCYNADCSRSCLVRWNAGKVLTAQTLDDYAAAHGCTSPQVCNGWSSVGNDYSFLIAADNLVVPGPINSTPACSVDFNRDGSLNTQDIFDYLSAWFVGCP